MNVPKVLAKIKTRKQKQSGRDEDGTTLAPKQSMVRQTGIKAKNMLSFSNGTNLFVRAPHLFDSWPFNLHHPHEGCNFTTTN